ncbi:hypothetical protein [Sinorhizobium americanum]|uniref:Uncharacterized protein n=1 Tax=Sinorhizobium americanum TaxID=194963 RepID=A0A1L3LZE0_9HYPH|nr:hypothetical protein [Sinorhizobium americanum]APG95465.1 hypothetical protein SAMCFNEI73_pC1761 [Sinorhizobium americanum]OAP45960.1 hypothetical protein ATC00_02625 [Sinorhizobium americanum]
MRRLITGAFLMFIAVAIAAGAAIAAASTLSFAELYEKGSDPSAKTKALTGSEVEIVGYMAPPLKAQATFFVLTKMPMAVCPFCDSTLDWPTDIVLIKTSSIVDPTPFNFPIKVVGKLEVGFEKDPETGFVSFLRLTDAVFERL